MGRWAQARRRGGGPPGPAAALITILSVENDETTWKVTFSGDVTINGGEVPDGFMEVDGFEVTAVSSLSPTVKFVTTDGVAYVPGLVWELTAQPGWLLTPVRIPQSGLTT